MIPGEMQVGSDPVTVNEGRRTVKVLVANSADRPIQVGSHFHFFEANRELKFDRKQAFGMRLNVPAGTAVRFEPDMRLNVPAGTAVRFEPGDSREVTLVELSGARTVYGLNGLTNGKAVPKIKKGTGR